MVKACLDSCPPRRLVPTPDLSKSLFPPSPQTHLTSVCMNVSLDPVRNRQPNATWRTHLLFSVRCLNLLKHSGVQRSIAALCRGPLFHRVLF